MADREPHPPAVVGVGAVVVIDPLVLTAGVEAEHELAAQADGVAEGQLADGGVLGRLLQEEARPQVRDQLGLLVRPRPPDEVEVAAELQQAVADDRAVAGQGRVVWLALEVAVDV